MKINARQAVGAQRGRDVELPRPFAAALPYAVLVPPAALAAALAGLIVWPLAGAFAGAALLAALVRAAAEQVRKARQRSWAEAWLRGEAWRRPPTAVLDARREELVSDRQRRKLAGSLRHLVRESRRFALPGASPANFRAVYAHAESLEALAIRLEASGPVSARGVALGLRLLTNPEGPLYDRRKAGELGEAADRIARALEVGDR